MSHLQSSIFVCSDFSKSGISLTSTVSEFEEDLIQTIARDLQAFCRISEFMVEAGRSQKKEVINRVDFSLTRHCSGKIGRLGGWWVGGWAVVRWGWTGRKLVFK